MVEMAKEFWNHVKTKTPPPVSPIDNEVILKMFPTHNEEFVENQEIETKIAQLQKVKSNISVLEEEKEVLELDLKNAISNHIGILTEKYKVTWKAQTSNKVSVEKLKADGIYEKYLDKSSTRVLRITANKKAA